VIEKFYTDDLDGPVTLYKSTEEGTETVAVFDEEHREIIEYLAKEVNRFREASMKKNGGDTDDIRSN
jgi:hypothetical protein